MALEMGLHYVYEGNIRGTGAHTYCPSCKTLVVQRSWHDVQEDYLQNGGCPKCGLAIPGRWTNARAQAAGKRSRPEDAALAERYEDLNL